MRRLFFTFSITIFSIFSLSCDAETLAALKAALLTEGCMNADNAKYNALATSHNQDSCAVQIYGCMDATALNYDATATNTCKNESTCCTLAAGGCTDKSYKEYDATKNTHVQDSCITKYDYGCLTAAACNYAGADVTKDCDNKPSSVYGTNPSTKCCDAADSVAVTCVMDFNNDGFTDANTSEQTIAAGGCGCGTLDGYGWVDKTKVNGVAVEGCTQPWCPEYNPLATMDNGACCMTSLEDLASQFGDQMGDVFADSSYFESDEFNLLGGYRISDTCMEEMSGDHKEEGHIFIGFGGTYFEEHHMIEKVKGFRAPPMEDWQADNPLDCEEKANTLNTHHFCANQVEDMGAFEPCETEIYDDDCWERSECMWEAPECRYKTEPVVDACHAPNLTQATCTANPGCQWDNEWNNCYFDCWGLSQTVCQNSALSQECMWYTPQAGVEYGDCVMPTTITNQTDCVNADPNKQCDQWGCWGDCWAHMEWNDQTWTDDFVSCQCWVEHGSNAESDCAAYGGTWTVEAVQGNCEPYWDPNATDPCDSYGNQWECYGSTAGCEWDEWGCFKPQGAECWEFNTHHWGGGSVESNKVGCTGNADCEWFSPSLNSQETALIDTSWLQYADEGVCRFFDWCNQVYCPQGNCDEDDCLGDPFCRWDAPAPGKPKTCMDDIADQWCDCRLEWTKDLCNNMPNMSWDDEHEECMQKMDEWMCYEGDISMGPEHGNIDCSQYMMGDEIHERIWIPGENVCEDIYISEGDGTWDVSTGQLCIESDDIEPKGCSQMPFEECQCNLGRCHWMPTNPSNPQQFNIGSCMEGEMMPPQTRSAKTTLMDNYKYNTITHRYQNSAIINFMNYFDKSYGSSATPLCMDYSQNPTTRVITIGPDPEGCTYTLTPLDPTDL